MQDQGSYLTGSNREKLTSARRIVIKVGTSTLIHDNGRFNLGNLEYLCRSIANQMNQGREVILVSSGAIGAGVGRLRLQQKPTTIRDKQAVSAVGQSELMSMYSRLMSDFNYVVAQILLTRDDIEDEHTRTNICNTIQALFEKDILPVVNENDSVSTREIFYNGTFGDNDALSAIVGLLVDADLLIILSDIDGLYNCDPRQSDQACLIHSVDQIDDQVMAIAGGEGTNRGTGGMRSKIEAARIATNAGLPTVIANGSTPGVIDAILKGEEKGTLFRVPSKS